MSDVHCIVQSFAVIVDVAVAVDYVDDDDHAAPAVVVGLFNLARKYCSSLRPLMFPQRHVSVLQSKPCNTVLYNALPAPPPP